METKDVITVKKNDLIEGLRIIDDNGKKGIVLDCSDLHNVHIILDGTGLLIKNKEEKEIECGGSGLYCFDECKENTTISDPIYFDYSNKDHEKKILTANNVHNIFTECLFEDSENKENHKIGEGVMVKVGFHPGRLEANNVFINEMLDELSDDFKEAGGGGMSFLNMCNNKNGNQWADLHQTMDELVCLGNAIGKLSFTAPKDLWSVLPGGMPYLTIKK
jgi:hypothetical protein